MVKPRATRSSARTTRNRSSKPQKGPNDVEDPKLDASRNTSTVSKDDQDGQESNVESTKTAAYILDGVQYDTYADYVAAKRQRNEDRLRALGFLDGSATPFLKANKRGAAASSSNATQRGIKRTKTDPSAAPTEVRKSSRLSGSKTQLISLDYYVNDWNRDNTAIVRQEGEAGGENDSKEEDEATETFFKGRVNDGSDLSLEQAIELNDPKWNRNNSLSQAQALMNEMLSKDPSQDGSAAKALTSPKKKTRSPTSVVASISDDDANNAAITSKVNALSIDKEEWVAKVTPDRIYYVATHPSESKLVCCAGDKQGYVGLWDVDAVSPEDSNNNHGVSLFRPHSRPISCLEWLNHDNLVTASYDGSVRRLNVEKGVFEEIFATYDDSDSTYLEDLGYGLDQGYRYWTQYVTTDPRSAGMSNPCLFVSTSFGDVFHVDLRSPQKGMITFHESVSDKKVNTVRCVQIDAVD